ncbi:MAG TPA: hypothetical protein VGM11_10955 [Acidobacteriaceae bacterium]
MQSLGCLGMALLQEDAGSMQHDVHLMMIFMAIIAAGVICGFIGVGIAGMMGLKLVRKVEEMAERAEAKLSPMLDQSRLLIDELGPKVRTITTNVEQISYTVRGKVDEFSATASDINRTVKDVNARTQAKVTRVDAMVTDALNTAHHVSQTVQDSVRKPIQQVAGIIAGLKRGIETFVEKSPFARRAREASVEDEGRAYGATQSYRPAGGTKRTSPYDL